MTQELKKIRKQRGESVDTSRTTYSNAISNKTTKYQDFGKKKNDENNFLVIDYG